MRILILLFSIAFLSSCKNPKDQNQRSDNNLLDTIVDNKNDFREFKVLDSKYIIADSIWKPFESELKSFTETDYNKLKTFVLDKDIPTIQKNIASNKLTYEDLVKFYLYRIKKYDRENEYSLNAIISLNPRALDEARKKDEELKTMDISSEFMHSVFGMPILLKDNINTISMPTTAGAVVLKDNYTDDAFIVKRLKSEGAIILGKGNLSEWAYFFCGECPSGYSALGGQTLNPYGRRIFDTGGSSSGSGVAVAANFCLAAVGSETSGSILSPSSQNSVVGLKPTVGLLSRSGIVPISSTLDTPGPMTKNVTDNAILLNAMLGYDPEDKKSIERDWKGSYFDDLEKATLKGKRLGVFKTLMKDSLYLEAIEVLKKIGAETVEFEPLEVDLPGFLNLLNLDMKKDLPDYLSKYASSQVKVQSVEDIIAFNKKDSINIMPYGQLLFEGIVKDSLSNEAFLNTKSILKSNGRKYFDSQIKTHNLDGFLSIDNYHAGYAAVAEYPAITVPMGYSIEGEPKGLTFISTPWSEGELLGWAYRYEQASQKRKSPKGYN